MGIRIQQVHYALEYRGWVSLILHWVRHVNKADKNNRFIKPIMANSCLILLWCLFGILFYFKGKTFRRWSKNSSVHSM